MLKLFIWSGFMSDYTAGVAVVLAETPDEAKRILFYEFVAKMGYPPQEQGEKNIETYKDIREPEELPFKKGVIVMLPGGS
jgi:hypothetical protein